MYPNYDAILQTIYAEVQPLLGRGHVASYIPQLAQIDPQQFGMAIYCLDGRTFDIGDAHKKFSLQSVTKLFALALAFSREGDTIWARVGREPSGNPFNSLVQIEHERGKPRNPFINAGALVISDILSTIFVQSDIAVIQFARAISGQTHIDFDIETQAVSHYSFGSGKPIWQRRFCTLVQRTQSCAEYESAWKLLCKR